MSLLRDGDVIFLLASGLLFTMLLCLGILSNWRLGLILVFIALYFEDIVRRLFSQFGLLPEVTLIKDFFLAVTYFAFFVSVMIGQQRRLRSFGFPFLTILLLFAGAVLAAGVYSALSSPAVAMLGFKSMLWYVPLMFLGYAMFEQENTAEQFCRILVYTSIPLTLFAAVQFFLYDTVDLPIMRPLAGTVSFRDFDTPGSEGVPRVTSVFGVPLRLGNFSLLLFILGMALQSVTPRRNLPLIVATIAAALGVLFSAQRTAMFLLGAALICSVLLLHQSVLGQMQQKVRGRWLSLLGIPVLAIALLFIFVPEVGAWIWTSLPETNRRLFSWLPSDVAKGIRVAGFFGSGLGVLSVGAQHLVGGRPDVPFVESGIAKLWVELGLFGVVTFYLLMFQILRGLYRAVIWSITPFQKAMSTTALVFLGCTLFWFSFVHHLMIGDPTTTIPLWFFIGLGFRSAGVNAAYTAPEPVPMFPTTRIHQRF